MQFQRRFIAGASWLQIFNIPALTIERRKTLLETNIRKTIDLSL